MFIRCILLTFCLFSLNSSVNGQLELTNKALEVYQKAEETARKRKNPACSQMHLARALFEDQGSFGQRLLKKSISGNPTAMKVRKTISNFLVELGRKVSALPRQSPAPLELGQTHELSAVLRLANKERLETDETHIGLDQYGIFFKNNTTLTKFEKVEVKRIRPKMNEIKNIEIIKKSGGSTADEDFFALETYALDLVAKAEAGELDPVIGRDIIFSQYMEIRRAVQILSRRKKNNPVFIGDPGVGKTSVAEGLAQRIVSGMVYVFISFFFFFFVRNSSVIAEAERSSHVILFIDEIHSLIGSGGGSSMDGANLLKPALARSLRVIGATTTDEYRKYIEKDKAFERRFQKVLIEEPNVENTIAILRGLRERYEAHHGVRILDETLRIAARLSDRYISHRFNPDKAIDLIDEACAKIRQLEDLERKYMQLAVEQRSLQRDIERGDENLDGESPIVQRLEILQDMRSRLAEEKERMDSLHKVQQDIDDLNTNTDVDEVSRLLHTYRKHHDAAHIAEVVSQTTGIPLSKLSEGEKSRILSLGNKLHERIIGQNDAIDAVTNAVLRSRAGIGAENQPSGSFLFLGPTGVGKTELAKALAEQLFDDENAIVRLDMSEYSEKHSVARMIGSPPGYIGHDSGGQLTEAVRRKPYCVVLLDEIEKAHQIVLTSFLQVLDDGRLTDGKGVTVDFSNTYIIMTSNLGSQFLADVYTDSKNKQKVKQHFRPEFLNRLDDIIIFASLSMPQLTEITRILQAYEPMYGARPLRRYIHQVLGTEIAKAIMEHGRSKSGMKTRNSKHGPNIFVDGDATGSLSIEISLNPEEIQPSDICEGESGHCNASESNLNDLPEDWVSYTDEATQKTIFYNKVTKEMTWDRPKSTA
eukprot:GSMAST32.ASY1.ANO1.1583.1 assembled CDS